MKYKFDRNDYASAVHRELSKRVNAYPRMLKKKKKQGMEPGELSRLIGIQYGQNLALRTVYSLITERKDNTELHFDFLLAELIREYKMRVRCYPRFVKVYKSITQETADYETAVWKEICLWFIDNYFECTDTEVYFMACVSPIRSRNKAAD